MKIANIQNSVVFGANSNSKKVSEKKSEKSVSSEPEIILDEVPAYFIKSDNLPSLVSRRANAASRLLFNVGEMLCTTESDLHSAKMYRKIEDSKQGTIITFSKAPFKDPEEEIMTDRCAHMSTDMRVCIGEDGSFSKVSHPVNCGYQKDYYFMPIQDKQHATFVKNAQRHVVRDDWNYTENTTYSASDVTILDLDNRPIAFIDGYSTDSLTKTKNADVIYSYNDGKMELVEKDSDAYKNYLSVCPSTEDFSF